MGAQVSTSSSESRQRGAGFPQLSLRESVNAVIILGQHGPSHGHDAAAAYLGHSTANSGAFRTKLAALRDWGLLVRGDKDRVMLSELAQRLVLEAPDHQGARQLLLAAFESCRVFGILYNDSAKDTPLDLQRLRNVVVMRYNIASGQVDKFVDSFIESIVYAGLGSFDGGKVTLLERDAMFGHDADLPESAEETSVSPVSMVNGTSRADLVNEGFTPVAHEAAIPIALRQAWPVDHGEIEFVIRTSKPLPPSIYALMAKMAVVADEMKETLTDAAADSTAANAQADYRDGFIAEPSGD